MSDIATILGQRIRYYRKSAGWSQETLAELSGCHSTYIGQLERGEKNATVESVGKIASALNISLSTLFADIGIKDEKIYEIPTEYREFILNKTTEEQKRIYKILLEIDNYKNN
ncbi:MAG: helix-turn-helix transcriptional regulator [Clostridia bacterium]|nr:helix-turn-helix transcriptional regulator [Clostridia bacterium]